MTGDGLTTPAGSQNRTVETITEMLRLIDDGELQATSTQRAYLAGALVAVKQITQS